MKHLAIVTLGTNDLRVNTAVDPTTPGKWFAPSDRDHRTELTRALGLPESAGARQVGETVLSQLQAGRLSVDRLRFPMVTPFLHHVEHTHGPLDRLVFIVTDQNPPHPHDTLALGQVITATLRHAGGPPSIDLVVLRGIPGQFDVVYCELGQRLADLIPDPVPSVTVVSLLVSGGTPAIQSATYQRAINRFGRERCRIYQASRPHSETAGLFSSIHETDPLPVLRDFASASLRSLIDGRSFPAAFAFHQQYLQGDQDELARWLHAATLRLRQRYGEAHRALPAPASTERRSLRARWQRSLRRAVNQDRDGLLQRLFEGAWAAELALRAGETTEALWRISFVVETASRILAAHLSGEPQVWTCFRKRGDQNPNDPFAIDPAQCTRPAVTAWLRQEIRGITISRRAWLVLVDRLDPSSDSMLQRARALVGCLEPLMDARNDALHSGATPSLSAVMPAVVGRLPDRERQDLPPGGEATLPALLERLCDTVATATGFAERYRPNPYDALATALQPLVTALASRC